MEGRKRLVPWTNLYTNTATGTEGVPNPVLGAFVHVVIPLDVTVVHACWIFSERNRT